MTFVPGENISLPHCELTHLGVSGRVVTLDVSEKPHSRPADASGGDETLLPATGIPREPSDL